MAGAATCFHSPLHGQVGLVIWTALCKVNPPVREEERMRKGACKWRVHEREESCTAV